MGPFMYNDKVMKHVFTFFLISFFSLFINLAITADVIPSYDLEVKINEDLTSSFKLKIELQNNSESSLISAYNLNLPYKVTTANADLDGIPVSILLDSTEGESTIKVDFLTNVVKPSQKAILNLQIFTVNTIIENFNTKQFYLPYPNSNFKYQNSKVKIIYPNSFNELSYISEYKYEIEYIDSNHSQLTLQQEAPLSIMWGQPSLSLKISTQIENRKDSINHYLLGLIPEYSSQTVDYLSTSLADYALIDKFNNNFAFITLNGNSKIEYEYSANITKSNLNDSIPVQKYNWPLNLDSVLGQKIYSKINQGLDSINKLKSLNEFLLEEYNLVENNINSNNIESIWDNQTKNINPLQYCFLVVSTAEYMGLNARIEYGYKLLNVKPQTEVLPSIWCSVQVDNNYIVFDITSKKIKRVDISRKSSDRIRVGIWHPSQTYNDALGLFINSPFVAKFLEKSGVNGVNSLVELMADFPKEVYSGEFYSGILNISNPTPKLLKFNELNINQESIIKSLNVGDLIKAIMPLQRNSIKVDYLRENDFILDLSRTIEIEVDLNGNKLVDNTEVKFTPDLRLILIIILLLAVLVFVLGFILFKAIKRKV